MTKRFDFTMNWKDIAKPFFISLGLIYFNIALGLYNFINTFNKVQYGHQDYSIGLFQLLYPFFYSMVLYCSCALILRKILNNIRCEEHNVQSVFSIITLLPIFLFISFLATSPSIILMISQGTMATVFVMIFSIVFMLFQPYLGKKIIEKILDKTTMNENKFSFTGKAEDLVWSFLKVFGLFILIIIALSITTGIFSFIFVNNIMLIAQIITPVLGLIIGMFFGIIFQGIVINWFTQFIYNGYNAGFKKLLASDYIYYASQFFLAIITLGIYFPKALLKVLERFLPYVIISSDEKELELKFGGNTAEGYALLVKQYCFQVITFGIYTPFALQVFLTYILQNVTLMNREEEFEPGDEYLEVSKIDTASTDVDTNSSQLNLTEETENGV